MRFLPRIPAAGLRGGLAALAVLALAGCAPDSVLPEPEAGESGWVLVNPRPLDFHITDLWGVSPRRMFAVGQHGGIAVREGAGWSRVPSPTSSHIWDIHGCDWQHVWAVSDEGLLRFDGLHWRREGPADLNEDARVWCNGPDDVMVVTDINVFHHFDGAAWTTGVLPVDAAASPGDWLAGAPDGRFMAVGRNGSCARWAEDRWQVIEADEDMSFQAVCYFAQDSDEYWFVAVENWNEQSVRIYVPRGGYWYRGPSVGNGLFVDMAMGASNDEPYVLTSRWGSDLLTLSGPTILDRQLEGFPSAALTVFPHAGGSPDADLVLGARFGTILAGTLPTGSLQPETGGVPLAASDFMVWPNGDFAARDGNRILHGRSGSLWIETVAQPADIMHLWGPAPGTLYAAGAGGQVALLRDGLPPVVEHLGTDRDLLAIWGRAADDIWAGGWDATAHYDGSAWTVAPWTLPGALTRIAGGGSDQVFAMSDLGLGRWDGAAWVAAGPEQAILYHALDVAPDTGEAVIVTRVADGGARQVMRLRGGAWENLGTPGELARFVLAVGGDDIRVMSGNDWFGWQDGRWVALPVPVSGPDLYAPGGIAGNAEGGLYVGYNNGGLYHLDLGGRGLWR